MDRLPYYSNCVDWPPDKLAALERIVENGIEISRETFRRNCQISQSPPDWYPNRRPRGVTYFTLHRQPVYWYVHSAIEFVFAHPETIDSLMLA